MSLLYFTILLVGCLSSKEWSKSGPLSCMSLEPDECSFPNGIFDGYPMILMNEAWYDLPSYWCGACVEIVDGDIKTTAVVVGDCYDAQCLDGIVTSQGITSLWTGGCTTNYASATYKLVTCPDGLYTDHHVYEYQMHPDAPGTINPSTVQVLVRKHDRPIKKLEMKEAGSTTWLPANRDYSNYFNTFFITGANLPLSIRITSVDGQVFVDENIIQQYVANTVLPSNNQFTKYSGDDKLMWYLLYFGSGALVMLVILLGYIFWKKKSSKRKHGDTSLSQFR